MKGTVILDRETVAALLPPSACLPLVEEALRRTSARQACQPLRAIVPLPNGRGNCLGVMFGLIMDPLRYGAKVTAVYPDNPSRGLGAHQGAVLIFDTLSGGLKAIVNGGELTARRTAAATAVATQVLARSNAQVLALLGCGEQARHHLPALLLVRGFRQVRVWSRSYARACAFVESQEFPENVIARPFSSAAEAVQGADVICTLTSSSEPVLLGEWLEPGQHLNLVGSSLASCREVDICAVKRSSMFVDYRPMTEAEGGEYRAALDANEIQSDHILAEVGDVLLDRHPGRRTDDEITLFKSLGIPAEDLAAAAFLADRALAEDLGARVVI